MANLLFAPENLTRSGLETPEGVSLHAGWYNASIAGRISGSAVIGNPATERTRRRTISLVVTPCAVAIAVSPASSSGVTRAWIVSDRAVGFWATARRTGGEGCREEVGT